MFVSVAVEVLVTVEASGEAVAVVEDSFWALAVDLKWGADELTFENSGLGKETRLKDSYLDFVAEYHYSSNHSNLPASRYRQNQYLLGIQSDF